ncbi:hypothetical protein [Traorella massiliensis]|uniref:hypothetical protein n=1 Tax=Traorella massiliensis TaxID=1903263 RepID=UPI0008F9203A|nr:hypothetical protein [Traorella massiliensis]
MNFLKNHFKKGIALGAALFMIISLMPVHVSAAVDETLYQNENISISIKNNNNAYNPKTITFDIIVDGETVVEDKVVTDIPQANSKLIIDADGYDVTFDGDIGVTKGIDNNYNLQIGAGRNHELTINLASEKTSDDIRIEDTDSNTYYGTFSWVKGEATTSAYRRLVTVYVNGEYAYEQYVNTPSLLNNATGSNKQFWFTPSDDYNEEVTYNHPYALDTAANSDLEIYLTTKCPCGNPYCDCPGGTDCTCHEDCECELCNPPLGDNEIRTPYGVIEYKEPGLGGGYNLTVETYVNGVLKHTTDQLRIRSGEVDSLNFTPTSGYYYFNDENSYDLITDGASSWDQRTGWITIVGDRDDDNVLKVYLWTFENHASLDVERRLSVDDDVTGYIISYEAYNPETKQNEVFTYEATSFLAAQSQMIPINTDVTITAICNSPYEVSQWSSADAYTGVELTGSEGQNNTEAYGNSATIKVTSTAYTDVTVYIDAVREVKLPTEDDLISNKDECFDGNVAVVVDCINNLEHESSNYGLIADTFTIGQLEGNSATGYTTKVIITQPSEYVNRYNQVNGEHTRVDSDVKVITLKWEVVNGESQWKAVGSATYDVICDQGEDKPEKPDQPTVEELLLDNAVKIDCVNTEADHDDKVYGLKDGYTIGDVYTKDNIYYVDVTVEADVYVEAYSTDMGSQHTLSADSKTSDVITLVYTEEGWAVAENEAPVTFTVECEDGGSTTDPGDEEDPNDPTNPGEDPSNPQEGENDETNDSDSSSDDNDASDSTHTPNTGDTMHIYLMAASVSLLILCIYALTHFKKEFSD